MKIAPNLTLPDDAVTQTIALLARRGAGKTHTASVIAEEMLSGGSSDRCLRLHRRMVGTM